MKIISSIVFFLILFLTTLTSKAQTIELWGMTSEGGSSNLGTVFSIDTEGNHNIKHKFLDEDMGRGSYSNQLCLASNGKLYGLASNGGLDDQGVLFEYNTTNNTYVKKINFNYVTGINPRGSLIQATNGSLYGVSFHYYLSSGYIFNYDINSNQYEITYMSGYRPNGTLLEASDGNLYGTAYKNETSCYVIYSFDPEAGLINELYEFPNDQNNLYPNTEGLFEHTNGKLYGLTSYGGANNCGTIYEYDIQSDTLILKFEFQNTNSSKNPVGKLIMSDHQTLFGVTSQGGTNDRGAIFEFNINDNILNILYEFDEGASTELSNSLILLNNKLVGIQNNNGEAAGVIYELDLSNNNFFIKHIFSDQEDGANPVGCLTKNSNGELFGMTAGGGEYNKGTIFSYNPNTEEYIKKIDIHRNINGESPKGGVIQASNGTIYGLTKNGGNQDCGVLFKYDPISDEFNKISDIYVNVGNDNFQWYGSHPSGTLLEASNHKLYGTNEYGGNIGMFGSGGIFHYDLEKDSMVSEMFFEKIEGFRPQGNLIESEDGKLWGMTKQGGSFYQDDYNNPGNGVLFEYDYTTGTYTKKADLLSSPYGSLLLASNNSLYGMTSGEEASFGGQIFEYKIDEELYLVKYNFENGYGDGYRPKGNLIQASNHKLYGLTSLSGEFNKGVIFEYDIESDQYSKIYDFDGINGSKPMGSLLEASNGKLYGMTSEGGTHDAGVVFEFDIIDNEFVKIFDFDSINGKRPLYSALIEFNPEIGIEELTNAQIVKVFPNPTRGLVFVQAKELQNIKIYRINGQLLKTINTNNEFMSFNLKDKGVYMIRVSTKSSVTNHKVVVE